MTDVFLERQFKPGLAQPDVLGMAQDGRSCFEVHRVDWQNSLLSTDGAKMVCWFHSRDAESARNALRQVGADIRVLWPGTIHHAPDAGDLLPNVLVKRSFPEPVRLQDIQAIEDAGAWCLETHNVRFVRTFFSLDCRRMICLYRAPDAESVRLAQRQAGMPLDEVWAFKAILPFV